MCYYLLAKAQNQNEILKLFFPERTMYVPLDKPIAFKSFCNVALVVITPVATFTPVKV